MDINLMFIINSILFGVGLAMDAFSVSLANGLNEPRMKRSKHIEIAVVFAFFQALMPMLGWICVHTVVRYFNSFQAIIPWISLILLSYIGSKMIYEGKKCSGETEECKTLGFGALIVQGIATSIDALSVGFTIAEYGLLSAIISALIIAAVTFLICYAGVIIGKKVGTRLSGKANILGGLILIFIGLEIFISSFLK